MEFSRNVLRKVYARPKLRQKVSRRDVTRMQTWKRSALNRTKAFRVNGNAYILDEEALSPTIVSSTSRSETSLRRIPRTMTRRTRGETTSSAREMTDPQRTRAKSHKRLVESSAVDFIVHVEAFYVSATSRLSATFTLVSTPHRDVVVGRSTNARNCFNNVVAVSVCCPSLLKEPSTTYVTIFVGRSAN